MTQVIGLTVTSEIEIYVAACALVIQVIPGLRKKERKPKGGLRDERCGPLAPSRGGIKVDRVCEGWPVPVEKWESAWKEGGKMY